MTSLLPFHNRPRRRGGHSRVVGLRGAARDHDVGLPRERVRHQKLELARLVTAERQPREVITLDEDSWTASGSTQLGAQPMRLDDGRRQRGERDARLRFERHGWQKYTATTGGEGPAEGLISSRQQRRARKPRAPFTAMRAAFLLTRSTKLKEGW